MSLFSEKVLSITKKIPKGKVLTYLQVATLSGNPMASRAVGTILAKNQDESIPCHRVIKSNGSIGKYNGLRGESKQKLLEKEGMKFSENGKVVLKKVKNNSKKVLFICKGNWFRSQMAAAMYNKMTSTQNADSVGTYVGAVGEPEGQVLSNLFKKHHFFDVLEKNGMYLRNNTTKHLKQSMLDAHDIVVSMAEEPFIPDFLKNDKKVIWWNVQNPTSEDRTVVEETYKKIEALVTNLIAKSNYKVYS